MALLTHARILAASCRCYERLLILYPRAFRARFGEEMVLLFRDQCREALARRQAGAFAAFVLRALIDLGKSAVVEQTHCCAFSFLIRAPVAGLMSIAARSPWRFSAIAAMAIAASVVVAESMKIIIPAQIQVAQEWRTLGAAERQFVQDQIQMIHSKAVLRPVIDKLSLNRRFAEELDREAPLTSDESFQILGRRLKARARAKTSLVTISVSGTEAGLAVKIVNAAAESYWQRRQQLSSGPASPVRFFRRAEQFHGRPGLGYFVGVSLILFVYISPGAWLLRFWSFRASLRSKSNSFTRLAPGGAT